VTGIGEESKIRLISRNTLDLYLGGFNPLQDGIFLIFKQTKGHNVKE
jgi:hypothetical protein